MTATHHHGDDGIVTIEDGFGSEWENCHVRCSQEVVRPGKVQCQGLYTDARDEKGWTVFEPCPWGNTPHLEGQQNGSAEAPR